MQGYQTAFFMLHGIAVAATLRRCRRFPTAVAIVAALAFNLASGLLFFASVNQVVPFYSTRLVS